MYRKRINIFDSLGQNGLKEIFQRINPRLDEFGAEDLATISICFVLRSFPTKMQMYRGLFSLILQLIIPMKHQIHGFSKAVPSFVSA